MKGNQRTGKGEREEGEGGTRHGKGKAGDEEETCTQQGKEGDEEETQASDEVRKNYDEGRVRPTGEVWLENYERTVVV